MHEEWIYPYLQVPGGGLFVDCGAFVGQHSVQVAKTCNCRVIAIEPVSRHANAIADNAQRNNVSESVSVVRCCAGSNATNVTLREDGMSTRVDPKGHVHSTVRTLEDILAAESHIDVLKIDVEGMEVAVLNGLSTKSRDCDQIVVEVHLRISPTLGAEVREWAERNRFHCEVIHRDCYYLLTNETTRSRITKMNIEHSTADGRLQNMNRFISKAPPGIIIEVGVWKGGSLRYLAERHPSRQFYGFDTFEGMPESCELDNKHKKGDFGNTSFEAVQKAFTDLPNVTLVKGYFPDSDVTGDQEIAMVHCDVDLYESTLKTFRHLAQRIVKNGRMYCDDAFQATCEGATLALCQFAAESHRVPQFDLGSHPAFCF